VAKKAAKKAAKEERGPPCDLICCGPNAPDFDAEKNAHCPRCDAIMEMGLGPVGNPAWFHKLTPEGCANRTEVEKKHLDHKRNGGVSCNAGHYTTEPIPGCGRRLLVCKKTGQYVDLNALREVLNEFHEKKHGIGG